MLNESIQHLHQEVIEPLKKRFVGREEVVDLIALAVTAREHLFILGPPGTAKSALLRHFSEGVQASYFEYMLTRFSEPNEIFGPIDIARLREGAVVTVTSRMLPEAEFAFLDELFNANSAILNNLLTVLNERVYRRGSEIHRLPLVSLFSASNHLPEEDALRALFDRFLLRCHVKNLKRDAMPQLLQAGWDLENMSPLTSTVTADALTAVAKQIHEVDVASVREVYMDVVFKIRDLGIRFSDRRAVKVQKLLAAAALLCGRNRSQASDLWVLRYVWDREEQIEPLASLINGVLEAHVDEPNRHALAEVRPNVDGEELARRFDDLEKQLQAEGIGLAAIARLREQLADLSHRAAWLGDPQQRNHLLERARICLKKIG